MKDLTQAFKNILMSHVLKTIRVLYLLTNEEERIRLYFDPPYQRHFVWNSYKTTYFIETILLHAEFTPIVVFDENTIYEVIDGRQRCETIYRFLKDLFSLKASGLDSLWYLVDKKYSDLEASLKERISNAKIRVITIRFADEEHVSPLTKELMKREFFRRYNLNSIALKKEEVYKAQYLRDKINYFFKKRFQSEPDYFETINKLFFHKAKNLETQMQNIRQLLVLHCVPINKYATERDDLINKYYDYLSFENSGETEDVRPIFNEFKNKIEFICRIHFHLEKEIGVPSPLIFECLFWALSVIQNEKVDLAKKASETFVKELVKFIVTHKDDFSLIRGMYVSNIKKRFKTTSDFFEEKLRFPFNKYLKNDQFVDTDGDRMERYMKERFMPGLEHEYFTKATPTSSNIIDIVERMKNKKFLIRPPYQRVEVTDRTKASSIIESILLKIQLHPIYIFVRKDGVCEVIDGQQRLLSIIGFIGATYLDENGEMRVSDKHNFALNLSSGFLRNLHKKKFSQLSPEQQRAIKNFNIEIIEIDEAGNPDFRPEALFKRLNNKPCPIKEHSFEFWNSYVDRDLIQLVKNLYEKNSWIYLRKNNRRMLNEELFMHFIYLGFTADKSPKHLKDLNNVINIYKSEDKLTLKFKSKANITSVLGNDNRWEDFKAACEEIEKDFIAKLKVLTYSPDSKNQDNSRIRQLDKLLGTNATRTSVRFYLLWVILRGIPVEAVANSKPAVERAIADVFQVYFDSDSVQELSRVVEQVWASLRKNKFVPLIKNVLV